jgi:TetR/AcrR family transcriptional repressor of nem operon
MVNGMTAATKRMQTRERILASATAAFRGRGFAATGVDAVMGGAGLTHGGFYAHFRSKDELLAATLAVEAVDPARNRLFGKVAHLRGDALIAATITHYLSMWHRDHPECGCSIPTLGAELPRYDRRLGAAMASPVQRLAAFLQGNLPGPAATAPARAAALLALMVGGVTTARTLPPRAARAWLSSCRHAARRIAGLPEEPA